MSPTRRRFLKSVAWAPLLPAGLSGLESPPASPPLPSPPLPEGAASPEAEALAGAMAEVVRLRYGSHLSAAELATIRKSLAESVSFVDPIRKLKLGNGDEPVTVFQAAPPAPSPEKPKGRS